jgi:hypothetical protein
MQQFALQVRENHFQREVCLRGQSDFIGKIEQLINVYETLYYVRFVQLVYRL